MKSSTKLSYTGYRNYRLAVLQDRAIHDQFPPPCGTCSACCSHYDSITLQPHELHHDWLLADTPDKNGKPRLQRRADGSCIYQAEQGCSIYERRPQTCRGYDCRDFAMTGIQPMGEVGKASQRIAEQTLAAKQRADWIILGAIRMAAFQYCAEDPNHTAETASAIGLLKADEYLPQATHFMNSLDELKYDNYALFEKINNGFDVLHQNNQGKHMKDIISQFSAN